MDNQQRCRLPQHRDARRNSIRNHFGNIGVGSGLDEGAVGLVGGMIRTLKNGLEFNCQMQILPESKTIALYKWARHNDAEPGHGGVQWEDTVRTVARCVFGGRVWYRVGPLTDRTKAEDRMESWLDPGVLPVQSNARRHASTRSLSGMPRRNASTA